MNTLRIAAVPAILVVFGIPAVVTARAQATSPAATTVQLQSYTAPDKSASAGVPPGWQVTNAGSGAIDMTGPQGEAVDFKIIVAHDGPFQLGQRGPNGADLTMPSSARLSDKLVMVLDQQAALKGMPVPQVKYLYQAPIKMPSGMGQCGMFAISAAAGANSGDAMGIFCSLNDSSAQFFKTFLMYGAAPTTIAAQTVPTVEAIFKSYKLAPGWTQKILSPYTPADAANPGPGGSGYPSAASGSTADGPGSSGGYTPGPGGSGYPSAASGSTADGPGSSGGYTPGPGGSAGYPTNPPTASGAAKTAMDDGPGLGGGYNPGPGGSAGYPTPPPTANGAPKTAMDDGPGLGGGYNPGPGGSAGYPTPPPSANGAPKTAMDDGPGLGGGYNPGPGGSAGYPTPPPTASGAPKTAMDDGPGLGGGYNPGPGGSGYPDNGANQNQSYFAVLWSNQQAIDHGFVCVDANIAGNGSHPQAAVDCGGWKPN
jgi:hypothetical protein